MARFFSLRGTAPSARADKRLDVLPRPTATDESCASYAPGHQMHYIHQGQAFRSPSVHARNVIVEGHRVIVLLDSGDQLDFHHHDPDRLSSVLGLFPGSRVIYPKFHALRVGPYWFNCAPGPFERCGPESEVSAS